MQDRPTTADNKERIMKDKGTIYVRTIIAVAAIGVIVLIRGFYMRHREPTSDALGSSSVIDLSQIRRRVQRTIVLEGGVPSPIINLGISRGVKSLWSANSSNMLFLVKINGGDEQGGFQYWTPPSSTWQATGWKPPLAVSNIVTVQFILDGNDKKQLTVEAWPI
jgi:hypothetical protein